MRAAEGFLHFSLGLRFFWFGLSLTDDVHADPRVKNHGREPVIIPVLEEFRGLEDSFRHVD